MQVSDDRFQEESRWNILALLQGRIKLFGAPRQ